MSLQLKLRYFQLRYLEIPFIYIKGVVRRLSKTPSRNYKLLSEGNAK